MRDDPAPPPVVLECEDLAFDYDTHKDEFGLRDVSLRLRAGRALGVIGLNGAGKSTLLHAIMGDVVPASGSLHRNGTVGMLQQSLDETQDLAGALGVTGALACLARLEAGQGNVEDAAAADWTLPSRIEQALADTGLRQIPLALFDAGVQIGLLLPVRLGRGVRCRLRLAEPGRALKHPLLTLCPRLRGLLELGIPCV